MDNRKRPPVREKTVKVIDWRTDGNLVLFPENLRDKLAEEVFQRTELNPESRSFQLTVEEFGKIARVYQDMCDRIPGLYFYDFRGPQSEREQWMEECSEPDSDGSETESSVNP